MKNRIIAGAVSALLLGSAGALAVALPAEAHAGAISASSVCANGGLDRVVTYTLNWTQVPGSGGSIVSKTDNDSNFDGTWIPGPGEGTNRGTITTTSGSTQWSVTIPGNTVGNGPWEYAYITWNDGYNQQRVFDTRAEGLTACTVTPKTVIPTNPPVKDLCLTADDHYGLPADVAGLTYSRSGKDIVATLTGNYTFGALPAGWVQNGNSATYAFSNTAWTNLPCDAPPAPETRTVDTEGTPDCVTQTVTITHTEEKREPLAWDATTSTYPWGPWTPTGNSTTSTRTLTPQEAYDCLTIVTPVKPDVAEVKACGTYGSVKAVPVTGVTYNVVFDKNSGDYVVTAKPDAGYRFDPDVPVITFKGNVGKFAECAPPGDFLAATNGTDLWTTIGLIVLALLVISAGVVILVRTAKANRADES